jgi:uncharacterized protein
MGTFADILIVGAGPAGLSAALALSARSFHGKIIILELGHHHKQRFCPVDHNLTCKGCGGVCNVISGFGGSMHYGDGIKLSRFPSGRRLAEHIGPEAKSLEDEAVGFLTAAGPMNFKLSTAGELPFQLRNYPVAVISASQLQSIISGFHSRLTSRTGVELHLETTVIRINPNGSDFEVSARDRYGKSRVYSCRKLIIGVGRAGFLWWRSELRRLGLGYTPPHISLGLRFECPAGYLRNAAAMHPDFKASFNLEDTKVKTFCFCADAAGGGGRLKFARYTDFTLLDGHVVTEAVPTANFGLLVQLTDDHGWPRSYEWVTENILKPYRTMRPDHSSKPVVQWYPDFRDARLSVHSVSDIAGRVGYRPSVKDVEIGNLASLVGDYHKAFCTVFEEMTSAVGELNSGAVGSVNDFLVYGLEIESVWDGLDLSPDFETAKLSGLFVVGDCAGIAQGILQSMVSGIAAARALAQQQ